MALIATIMIAATLMSGGFTPATATLMSGGSAPATASNLLSPQNSPGSTNVPSAWVVNGSGSVNYSWHTDEPGACASGSQSVSWTANQAATFYFPVLGQPLWAFQIHADVDGHQVTSGVLFTWGPGHTFLGATQTTIEMALLSATCQGGADALKYAAITGAMMGKAQEAPQSSKMQCKRKKPPTTTLPNTPKPKWVCTISTGSSLVFSGGMSYTVSDGDAVSGHWTLTLKQGHAKKPPTLPKPTTKNSKLIFKGVIKGELDTSGFCTSAAGTLELNFGARVGGKPVDLLIYLGNYPGPGTFSVAAQSTRNVMLVSPASGTVYGTGTVTIAPDGRSGTVQLNFQGGAGSESVSGSFGCMV